MPMKPRKDETQSDFMKRCMPETIGTGENKRPQDQAAAICLNYWRDEHPGAAKPKSAAEVDRIIKLWCKIIEKQADIPEPEDGETKEDFMDRCTSELDDLDDPDAEDACQLAWEDYAEESGEDGLIIKTHDQAKASDGMEYILSDATPDRFGDIVDPKGWEYASFVRHPISLFNHNSDFPIGTWKNIRIDSDSLRGDLVLAPKGTSARIDEIRALVDAGILKAVSVGFKSIKSEPLHPDAGRGGPFGDFGPKRYLKQELVECSLVSIPANPNALAVAKSLRISSDTQRLVFGEHADRRQSEASMRRGEHASTRRSATGENARTSSSVRKGMTMPLASLSKRITDKQERIVELRDELAAHIDRLDDTNVSDADLQKTNDYNDQIAQAMKTLSSLQEAEKALGGTATSDGSRAVAVREHARGNGNAHVNGNADEIERRKQFFQATSGKKELQPLDYVVRAGVVTYLARVFQRQPEEICKTYAPYSDEKTRFMVDYNMRAATNPAMTTVTGWAAELVQQVYGDFMQLLLPKSVFPRLSAKGISMQFGRAGRIIIPTRNATPTIAGSFVGEGAPIPVRQGQFTSFTLVPKKLAVISTWTKEMDEHSIPAIEGLLRDAIQTDTAIAVDSVLLDSNPATAIRPAGLFNGVAPLTPTPITNGAFAAIVGDLKQLINALIVATKGNVRNPAFLMNPGDINSASFITFPNYTWAFRQEVLGGSLNGYPIIDSGTVPVKTIALVDAADFVTAGEEAPRFEVSDQATLHEEDTTPLPIVASGGSASSPVRSLWQTDSLALRMIYRLNWTMRRTGMVAWIQNLTW
jgi:HK97 family phage major capsid protein/HK97 family phage prohead protease